jgi:hypothetical protein
LIEHRKPASGLASDALVATITGRKAGFLLSNGSIVDLDGITPVHFDITKQGTAFITVRHINHLGVLSTGIPSNAAGEFTNNFNSLANVYKPAGAASDPLTLLSGATGKYGLWAGDANKNGAINSTDVTLVKAAIASSASGYQPTDINLNGGINSSDVTLTKATISMSGSGSGTNSFHLEQTNHSNKKVSTNLPDPVIED